VGRDRAVGGARQRRTQPAAGHGPEAVPERPRAGGGRGLGEAAGVDFIFSQFWPERTGKTLKGSTTSW
jgi:hypothetical protein